MGQDQTSGNSQQQSSADRNKSNPSSSNPNVKQSSDNWQSQSANKPAAASHDQDANKNPQQLKAKLKEAFGRLSEDEIALYDTQKDQFFTKLEDKYGLAREEAEDRIHEIEADQKAA